jgi:hypothetical protein
MFALIFQPVVVIAFRRERTDEGCFSVRNPFRDYLSLARAVNDEKQKLEVGR